MFDKIKASWQAVKKCYTTVFTPVNEVKEAFKTMASELKGIWKNNASA